MANITFFSCNFQPQKFLQSCRVITNWWRWKNARHIWIWPREIKISNRGVDRGFLEKRVLVECLNWKWWRVFWLGFGLWSVIFWKVERFSRENMIPWCLLRCVGLCPWWRWFSMRSVTCNWLRYSVHRKSWNRRLEQVWAFDFLCLRLSNFCLFFMPSLNLVLESWIWSSQDLESAFIAREIVTWRALGGGANPGWRWEDDERCIDVHSRLNHQPVFTAINKHW